MDRRTHRRIQRNVQLGYFVQDVTAQIEGRLPFGAFTCAEVAWALHVSRATLCRRLRLCGATYSRLFETARRERVLRLLAHPDMKIRDCALGSGFASTAALTRWCRRVMGVTPTELHVRLTDSQEARRIGQWRARRHGRRA